MLSLWSIECAQCKLQDYGATESMRFLAFVLIKEQMDGEGWISSKMGIPFGSGIRALLNLTGWLLADFTLLTKICRQNVKPYLQTHF